jgi:exoribonuclease R
VDRYALEICVSLCAETEVPSWVIEKLRELPRTMQESGRKASMYEGSILALVEAAVLHKHVGQRFAGVVVQLDDKDETKGDIVIQEPAVEATITGTEKLPLGTDVQVKLVEADITTRSVRFELA